jgi:hypothetical protein
MPEWCAYAKKIKDCIEITTVHHGTHVAEARRIIEDGMIEARLVYDESLLNTTRTSVTWFSPNIWVNGSRYGTVQFTFPWRKLLGGRNIYWVEVIKEYQPHACRFLLTDRTLKNTDLVEYDPETAFGPLRHRNGRWYRNPNVTLEFMLDEHVNVRCQRTVICRASPKILQCGRELWAAFAKEIRRNDDSPHFGPLPWLEG